MVYETKKIMYFETNNLEKHEALGGANFGIATSIDEDQITYLNINPDSVRLATVEEIRGYTAATGEAFEGLLELADGLYQNQYESRYDEYFEEFEIVDEYVKIA